MCQIKNRYIKPEPGGTFKGYKLMIYKNGNWYSPFQNCLYEIGKTYHETGDKYLNLKPNSLDFGFIHMFKNKYDAVKYLNLFVIAFPEGYRGIGIFECEIKNEPGDYLYSGLFRSYLDTKEEYYPTYAATNVKLDKLVFEVSNHVSNE